MSKSGTVTPSPIGNPKCYIALLTQTGTNAPVATVLQNTLGGNPVWSYTSTGDYAITLAGAWTANKTWAVCATSFDTSNGLPVSGHCNVNNGDQDSFPLQLYNAEGTAVDDCLLLTAIQILVYP